jgi:hypothetical protein
MTSRTGWVLASLLRTSQFSRAPGASRVWVSARSRLPPFRGFSSSLVQTHHADRTHRPAARVCAVGCVPAVAKVDVAMPPGALAAGWSQACWEVSVGIPRGIGCPGWFASAEHGRSVVLSAQAAMLLPHRPVASPVEGVSGGADQPGSGDE